jgi:hypothetical protein
MLLAYQTIHHLQRCAAAGDPLNDYVDSNSADGEASRVEKKKKKEICLTSVAGVKPQLYLVLTILFRDVD